MLGVDLEHAVDEEGEDAVDGDEDEPRRRRTTRRRIRLSRAILQEGRAQNRLQEEGYARMAPIIDGRRRILRNSPATTAEQGTPWLTMAAAADGIDRRNGNPSS